MPSLPSLANFALKQSDHHCQKSAACERLLGWVGPWASAGLLAISLQGQAQASDRWPQFRGPNASGIADGQAPPVEFGPGTNELFHVSVPPGASSPSIWGRRLLLTAYNEGKLETLCLDRRDGKVLWRRGAAVETIEGFHPSEGSPAASTPATDGERVYTYFGSGGLFCYDMEGQELWHLPMPAAQHVGNFGTGTSPICVQGAVVLNRDMLFGSHLLAVDAKSGKVRWRQERPEFFSSYSTPILWEHDEQAEIVVAGSLRMKAYNLQTGAETWEASGLPSAGCTTPVLGDGMLFFAGWAPGPKEMPLPTFREQLEKLDKNGDAALQRDEAAKDPVLASLFTFWDVDRDGTLTKEEWEGRLKTLGRGENSLLALRPGKGDLTTSHVAWKQTRGLPYVPSPLWYRGAIYLVKDGGMVSSFDAKSGSPHYLQERVGSTGSYYSSPIAAEGKIYITSLEGNLTVFEAGTTPNVLSRCSLGERCGSTPAIVDGTLYVRTGKHLWAFGQTKP